MQPLVLAIEPDLRQAAIVKRIVREKVLAEVTVVDSRDAALEAMRTTVPDVLLLSALLSPRDEDELIAHLRTLENAEHLQTHTIPQLASSIGPNDAKPRGLLSAFRRRKEPEGGTAGCDPELFAEEVRTYLQRASEKKREVRSAPPGESRSIVSTPSTAPPPRAAAAAEPAASEGSSWSSPFEWRPSTAVTATAAHVEPEPIPFEPVPADPLPVEPFHAEASHAEASYVEPPEAEPLAAEPYVADAYAAESRVSEPYVDESPVSERYVEEPYVADSYVPEPVVAEPYAAEPVAAERFVVEARRSSAPSVRYPLTMRTPRGWWFEEGEKTKLRVLKDARTAFDPNDEVRELLESLQVPEAIAGIAYAKGCRIRRVRLSAA